MSEFRWMRWLTLCLAAAMFLGGCPRMMGRATISLKDKNVTKIQAGALTPTATACPGQPVMLKVYATTADNRTFETWEPLPDGSVNKNDKLDFGEFAFAASSGTVDPETGLFTPPADSLTNFDQPYTVAVSLVYNSSIASAISLQPDYACIKLADWRAMPGSTGQAGFSGYSGSDGSYGGTGSNGGSGGDGSPGQQGDRGFDGTAGPAIDVKVAYLKSQCCGDLIIIKVSPYGAPDQAVTYITTPDVQNPLVVDASGGAGGDGGSGGMGGSGGSGGSGISGGNGGNGANGGNGGDGANGGSGGYVNVIVPQEHPEIGQFIAVINEGGPAGRGGYGGSGGYGGGGGSSTVPNGANGGSGASGYSGYDGRDGSPGAAGPPAQVTTIPLAQLFGQEMAGGLPVF